MFRLLYLLTIFIIVSGHWEHHHRRHCSWRKKHPSRFCGNQNINTDIEEIKNKFIEAEITLQRLCNKNSNIVTKEIYDDNAYSLIYALKDNDNYTITVNITHRLVHTNVKEHEVLILEDLKMVPRIVKSVDATWSFVKGNLDIRFPYKVPLGKEISVDCEAISAGEFKVPQNIGLDVRMNLILTENELINNEYNRIVFGKP